VFLPLKDVPADDQNTVRIVIRDLNGGVTTMEMTISEDKFSPASYAPELTDVERAITETEQVK
jgi:hypothetical protein